MLKLLKIHERKIYGGLTLFFLSLNLLIWSQVFVVAKKADITVRFFDVGQGDSALIESKDGAQILIDGGPNGRILSHLGEAMPFGDDSIDAIIISHPHADHIAGLIEVIKKYEIGMIIDSGVSYDTPEINELRNLIHEKRIKSIVIASPATLSFADAAMIRFLYPDSPYVEKTTKDVNETSLVALLEYGNPSTALGTRKILFTGDAGKVTEARLAQSGALEDIDVLKVGHQGSKFSSTNNFLNKILPEYAVISVGKNSYGHPHPDALSRLASVGAKIFRTDIHGTITLEIRNGDLIWK